MDNKLNLTTIIPLEIINYIVDYLELYDIYVFRQCCQLLASLINFDKYVKARTKLIDVNYEIHKEVQSVVYIRGRQIKHGPCSIYDDNRLITLSNYHNNRLSGKYIEYDDAGNIHKEYYDEYGKRHGEYKEYYKGTTILRKQLMYVEGFKIGICRKYHINGALKYGCVYDIFKHGKVIKYNEYGKIYKEYDYDRGTLIDGVEYDEGKIIKEITCVESNEWPKYDIVEYYNDCKTKQYSYYYVYGRNIEYDGPCKIYYWNGFVHEEYNYKNNQLNGIYKRYLTNGALIESVEYVNDLKCGVSYIYYGYPENAVRFKKIYHNNMLNITEGYDRYGNCISRKLYG